jgi:hypothetical protein
VSSNNPSSPTAPPTTADLQPAGESRASAADLQERLERLESELQALRMSTLAERRFVLDGESFAYHVSRKNRTWDNERAVEIPVAWGALQRRGSSEGVLEVGSVLGHYFEIAHPVLDKYEQYETVTWNEDVVTFEPPFAPELVLSISTLEHIGRSERPRDPGKFHEAIDAITGWLAPGGRLLFTVPLGYNPAVSDYLDSPHPARTVRCMRRATLDNLWVQADYAEVRDFRYGSPFPCANAIAIVEVSASAQEPAAHPVEERP